MKNDNANNFLFANLMCGAIYNHCKKKNKKPRSSSILYLDDMSKFQIEVFVVDLNYSLFYICILLLQYLYLMFSYVGDDGRHRIFKYISIRLYGYIYIWYIDAGTDNIFL